MSYTEKIHRKVQSLETDVIMPFSAAKVEGISTDTTRKILHRLHDNGVITIVKKATSKKKNPSVHCSLCMDHSKKALTIIIFLVNMPNGLARLIL